MVCVKEVTWRSAQCLVANCNFEFIQKMEHFYTVDEEKEKFFIAYSDGIVCGYASLTVLYDELILQHCEVIPQYRGLGIHKVLLDARLEYAEDGDKVRVICSSERSYDNCIECSHAYPLLRWNIEYIGE